MARGTNIHPEKLERPALRHSLSSAKRRCSSTPTTARPEADHPGRSGGRVWPKLAPCPRGEPLTPVSPQADADADPTAMTVRPIAVSCCPRWTGAGTLTGTAAEAPAEYEHQRDQVQVTRRAAEQPRRAVQNARRRHTFGALARRERCSERQEWARHNRVSGGVGVGDMHARSLSLRRQRVIRLASRMVRDAWASRLTASLRPPPAGWLACCTVARGVT